MALGRMMEEEAELRTWRNVVLQLAGNYLRFLSKGLTGSAMCIREINLISCRKNWDWGEMGSEEPSEKVIVINWRMEV